MTRPLTRALRLLSHTSGPSVPPRISLLRTRLTNYPNAPYFIAPSHSLSLRHNSTQTPQSFLKPPSKPIDPKVATMTNPEESSSPNTLTLPNHPSQSTQTASTQTQTQSTHTQPQSTPKSETETETEFDDADPPPDPNEPKPTSAYAKFKLLTKKYGKYALTMYLLLSTVDFSLAFILVHAAGIERIEPVLEPVRQQYRVLRYGEAEAGVMKERDEVERRKAEVQEKQEKEGKKGGVGGGWRSGKFWAEAGLAYAIHKTALLPLRAGLTVAWTPKTVKWLAARGWIGKGGISRATKHAQGKIRDVAKTVRPE